MDNLSKEELYFQRESIYLECEYSEDIENLYNKIKEYVSGNSELLNNLRLSDLQDIIMQYSSLYDVYYESEESEEEEIINEDYY